MNIIIYDRVIKEIRCKRSEYRKLKKRAEKRSIKSTKIECYQIIQVQYKIAKVIPAVNITVKM